MQTQNNPDNAFIIVDGVHIFVLTKEITTVGRMADNDLVVDNPRISRYHASIELTDNTYFMVDLNSTGGTSLNGNKVTRTALKPGDVISLAGVPLIYGEYAQGAPLGDFHSTSVSGRKKTETKMSATGSQEVEAADHYLDLFEQGKEDEDE